MSYLLDTNVLSESVRRRPDSGVAAWVGSMPEQSLFTSVLCLGEILKGIEQLPAGARRGRLERWLEHDLIWRFGERMLPIDAGVTAVWGQLSAATAAQPLPVVDGLLAATAAYHRLTVVTRNEADFTRAGIATQNPWQAT